VRAADGGLLEASSSTFDAARAAEDECTRRAGFRCRADSRPHILIHAYASCVPAAPADGADKWQTERALRAAAESGALARVLALRLPDVLGPHENTGRLEKLLSRLLKGRRVGCAILGTAACGEVPLGLVAADDVATAVCAAVEAPAPLLSGASTGEGGGSGVDDGGAHDCGSAATAAASPSNASSQPFAAVHVCSDERLTWRALVEQCAGAMRAHGLEVPPVRFDETRESGFVSVDVGALANGAAKEALRGWAPAPLRDRVAESVEWWVGSRHAERVARDAAPFRFAFDAPAPPDASSHQASQEEPPPAEERVVGQPPAKSLKTEQ
jgi:nucleoside-diphosphate-sugar epimerase